MHITTIFSKQYGQNRTGWPSIIDSHHIGICDVTIQQMVMESPCKECAPQEVLLHKELHSIEQMVNMVNMCRVHRAQLIQGLLEYCILLTK